jgi:hypothetical protein
MDPEVLVKSLYLGDRSCKNLIFEEVKSFDLGAYGKIPNDYINYIKVNKSQGVDYEFKISMNYVSESGESEECILKIIASKFYIQNNDGEVVKTK